MVVMTCCLSQALNADIFDAGTQVFKDTQIYGKNSKIGFEIINKSKNPIHVVLRNGDDIFSLLGKNIFTVDGLDSGARHTWRLGLDISKPTQMAVYYTKPTEVDIKKTGILGLYGPEVFSPAPDKLYTFTKDKTIYITWDKDNFARPQTGPLMGILNKTDSGLSLAQPGNVRKEDITESKIPADSSKTKK